MNWLFRRSAGDERLVALDQRALVALGIGDVGEGDERGAVGQRHRGVVDDALSGRTICPSSCSRWSENDVDGAADACPGRRVVVELAGLQDELVDVRLLGERAARQLPDLGESRVEQLEAPVGAEHRDAFLEAVERLALHVDQGVVARFQREALGLVVEQIGDAAVGALLGENVERAPVGQVPRVVLGVPSP